jgi:SAM-dependent methyltransferase
MIKRERLYKDLAWLWPTLSPPEDYIEEAEFLTKLIKSYISYTPKTMLHLGCGGGHVDMTFKKHFAVTGIDISENMLGLAQKLNPANKYLIGDMRNVRLKGKFDVVLLYDGIDYMTTEDDLKAAFETAYQHLNNNGIMLTVVEKTPRSFRQNETKVQHRVNENIELTYIEHSYDPDPGDSTYETTFVYLIRKDKILTVEHDLHICGMFEVAIWERLLREVGFTSKEDTFTHSTFSPGEEYPILVGFKGRNQ